jgi:hypothetical protein
MPATLTRDVLGMLAACHADDGDAVRLVLADALDEAGDERVPCPKCKGEWPTVMGYTTVEGPDGVWEKCPTCSGTVSDRCNSDRAELVRLQVKLAGAPPLVHHPRTGCGDLNNPEVASRAAYAMMRVCPTCCLKTREAELIAANSHWLSLPCPEESLGHLSRSSSHHCPVCGGSKDLFKARHVIDNQGTSYGIDSIALLDRGLVVLVADAGRCWETVQVRDVCERPVRSGVNTGTIIGLPKGTVVGRCGLCPPCLSPRSVTRPKPWLEAVAACPWVVGVDVSDKVPYHHLTGFGWCSVQTEHSYYVPQSVFDLMHGEVSTDAGIDFKLFRFYSTPELATRALSRAILAWARAPKGV